MTEFRRPWRPKEFLEALRRRWQSLVYRRQPAPSDHGDWFHGWASSRDGALHSRASLSARPYRLYRPSGSEGEQAVPLLIMLHGCRQDPSIFAAGTRMNRYARRRGWLVLYPGQTRNANPLRCWNWFDPACQAGRGEIAIIAGMIDEICGRHPVDPQQIFVAGLSAGGALAALLAAHHPTRIRAAAVHSGLAPAATAGRSEAYRLMRTGDPDLAGLLPSATRDALRMPPLMVIHGDQDNVVIAENGQLLVEAALSRGSRNRRRSGRRREIAATARSRAYTITDYRAWGRLKVRDCRINGLGHAWSGGDDSLAYFDREGPSASGLIMRFFEEIAGV